MNARDLAIQCFKDEAAAVLGLTAIQQRAARPPEAAMGHSPAIERRSDPSQLTADDLDEINRRVEMGETFAF